MINFFRKIRQNLVMENKTAKYLKYAIGEIVLVVIGILIALQINNWNELRKYDRLKDNYLERLIGDIKMDTTNINYRVSEIEKNQICINQLIKSLNPPSDYKVLDTIITNYFERGWIISEYTASANTYIDLSQTGNMKIINNSVLIDKIIEYYGYIDIIDKSNITNKNWITPLDIDVAKTTSAFELDPSTSGLFSHKNRQEAIKNMLSNIELLERNAAGHYWINTSLAENLIALKGVSISLMSALHEERENMK